MRGPYRPVTSVSRFGAWVVLLFGQLLTSTTCFADAAWLKADGPDLVDSTGKKVVLRGVSLGGWLVEEMWMQPFVTTPPPGSPLPAVEDHGTLWEVIGERLGEDSMRRVRTAFRSAWIEESDFDRIRDAGFNSVRLGFLYDLLDEPDGLRWLDRAVDWAAKRNLYVVLDLHGAPGGQSADHHTGKANQNAFFKDARHVERTEWLWRRVAERYRDRPEVAAFDMLNEPMGAPDRATLYVVQNRLYQAIRRVDAKHVVIFEDGYTGLDHVPSPSVAGWNNVMMSCHHYVFKAKSVREQAEAARGHVDYMRRNQKLLGCPLYLGEFNQEPYGSPETMAAFIRELDKNGWGWAIWTYKIVQAQGTQSMWGLYRNQEPVKPVDPYRDSEAEMIRKCDAFRASRLQPYPGLLEAIRDADR